MAALEKFIDDACVGPDGEWWKAGAQETFYNRGQELVVMGFSPGAAAELLGDLYRATASCYGE